MKDVRKQLDAAPVTKLELDQRDADNFPLLLDFIYASATRNTSQDTVLTAASTVTSFSLHLAETQDTGLSQSMLEDRVITTDNAVSLRFLAKTFEVDSLSLAVNKFIQKDLNFETGPFYLTKGWEYQDDRIISLAQNLCAENFEQLDVRALIKLPLSLFRVIVKALETFDAENEELSVFLSDVVSCYFEKNTDVFTAPVLLELTDSILMPCMSSNAALRFTTLVKSLEDDEAFKHWSGLMSLCHRCAQTVVREYGWSDFSVRGAVEEYLGQDVSKIDSLLFATSFAAALEQAQDDYLEFTREQRSLETTLNELSQSVSLMEVTNHRKDEVLAKQDQMIAQAKQQILSLKEQIRDMRKQHEDEECQREPERERQRKHQLKTHNDDVVTPSIHPLGLAPPPPPPPPPPRGEATKSRVHAVVSDLEAMNSRQSASAGNKTKAAMMTAEEIVRDLISPSIVQGSRAGHQLQRNLQTREEMRKKSLL
jgi:hypothetical protein